MGTLRADRFRRTAASASLVVAALALAGCASIETSDATDAELERMVEREFGDGDERSVAVALIAGDEIRTAYVGADEGTAFPIISISKVLTGELLAEGIEEGEVALDDELGEYLPLGDSPVAEVTLGQLATHTSGLPRDLTDPELVAQFEEALAAGEPLDAGTVEDLVAYAGKEPVVASDTPVYSNLGAALLGHALAAAAGTDYPTLLEDRLLGPLGMDGAVAPTMLAEIPSEHPTGYDSEWADAAYAPSSGVFATLPDLVALARAVIDGGLSDSAAIEPIAAGVNGSDHVGYLWELTDIDGRTYLGKDGAGIGFSSTLLIDRDAQQAAIVLVNQADTVDRTDALRYLELLQAP